MIFLAKGKLLREVVTDVSVQVLFFDVVFTIKKVSGTIQEQTNVTFVNTIALIQESAVHDAQIHFSFLQFFQFFNFFSQLFFFQRKLLFDLLFDSLLLFDIFVLLCYYLLLSFDLSF